MNLFHFTAMHHLTGGPGHAGPGIQEWGIQPNQHPLIGLPAGVWLTADDSWAQMWSPRVIPGIDCDRTEVRLALVIPQSARNRLLSYDRVRPFVNPEWRDDFEGGFDLTPWRLYLGRIPFGWVRWIAGRSIPPELPAEARSTRGRTPLGFSPAPQPVARCARGSASTKPQRSGDL